ncbi:MAG: L-threonylcarbamoyladenylate synthase [Tissierellia bacterium]|nr:L-threonylcarbamoyladenylate synthase [Tissierellia bacterium]
MKTQLVKIDEDNIDIDKLNSLAQIIEDKGLVAIPTETVYGLACNGLDQDAIKKVFQAKNRPMDNPLILHIADIKDLYPLVREVRDEDIGILKELWPGPLTAIFKKSDLIPDGVSAGLDTVAIRLPNKKLTREFIKLCKRPLAAPSANLSTKPSPTNAMDVYEDMQGRIDAIIDGGASTIGLESTVVDLSEDRPTILRPGYYTKEILAKYWERIDYDLALKNKDQVPKSPGQKYKHYAPKAKVEVYVGSSDKFREKLAQIFKNRDNKIGLMVFEEDGDFQEADHLIKMGTMSDLNTMAKVLFTALRDMDHKGMDLVIVHGVEEKSFGLSIMNRLKKAASGNVYKLEE